MRPFALTLTLFLATAPTLARGEAPTTALEKEAERWTALGRLDRARDAWTRLALVTSSRPRALGELAEIAALDGDRATAELHLAKLEAASPNDPRLPWLRRAVALGKTFEAKLDRLRALAAAGKLGEARTGYRELFLDAPPDRLALEYWETMGGDDTQWAPARSALEALAARRPGDARVALALAKHLTHRAESRRDGIAALLAIGAAPEGTEALTARKQALLWLDATPEDLPLFRAQLERGGPDPEIEAKIAELSRRPPPPDRLGPAFAAISEARLDAATALLQRSIEEQGRSASALVGLAVVALREGHTARALERLEEAKRLAPDHPEVWGEAMKGARFSALVEAAESLVGEGRAAEGKMKAEAALALGVPDPQPAEIALAHAAVALGDIARADSVLRDTIARGPDDHVVPAARELALILAGAGRLEEAEAVRARFEAVSADAMPSPESLQAESLRAHARALRRDDPRAAFTLLEEAARLEPKSTSTRLELVHLALELGELDRGREQARALLELAPTSADVNLAASEVELEQGALPGARRLLEAIPSAVRNDAWRALDRRLTLESELARLRAEVRTSRASRVAAETAWSHADRTRSGTEVSQVRDARASRARDEAGPRQLHLARVRLAALEKRHADAPRLLAPIALAWSELGDDREAAAVLERALTSAPAELQPSLQLTLAAVLDRAGRDTEAEHLLEALERTPLAPRDAAGLDALRVARAIRALDDAADATALTGARTRAEAELADHPDEPRLLFALARAKSRARDHAGAEVLFARLLAQSPDEPELAESAAANVLALGKRDEARAIVERGARERPNDARALLAVARISSAVGADDRALDAVARAEAGGPAELSPELAEVKAHVAERHRVGVRAALVARSRSGEPGLGELSMFALDAQARVPVGLAGHLELHVSPTLLARGRVDPADPSALGRFVGGTLASDTLPGSAEGVALGLAFESDRCTADVGSTPLGFPVATVVGGARCNTHVGPFSVGVDLSRRAVEESVLSYAGVLDPDTGRTSGGVTANGGRLDVGLARGDLDVFGFGGAHWLLGQEVPTNRSIEAGAGLSWKVHETRETTLRAGLLGSWMGFSRNLRYFTFGQGGYFSPSAFVHAGIPVRFDWTTHELSASVRAEPGIDAFHERAAPYFPDDAARQTALEDLVRTGMRPTAWYAATTRVGPSFDVQLDATYAIAGNLGVTLALDVHTAESYRAVGARALLRYDLDASP